MLYDVVVELEVNAAYSISEALCFLEMQGFEMEEVIHVGNRKAIAFECMGSDRIHMLTKQVYELHRDTSCFSHVCIKASF
jgi:hypothetical protein